jgi:CHASE3 domain sensor protein
MVYPLRNLLISFAIIIIVVLLIVLRAFSTLRSQEKEEERIVQSREVLQKLGPAIVNLQEFEPAAVNYYITSDKKFLDEARFLAGKLKQDSAAMSVLASLDKANAASFTELASIIHKTMALASPELPSQVWQDAGVTSLNPHIRLVDTFKTIASGLEIRHSKALDNSYSQSINFTRYTFSFVRIIFVLIAMYCPALRNIFMWWTKITA